MFKTGLSRLGFASRAAALNGVRSKHTLPDLPYDYNALEPYISAEIMQLHHAKHHQTYVTNINVAEEKLAEAVHKNNTAAVLALNSALTFNYGGHVNHSIFWKNLAPQKEGGGDLTKGVLHSAIQKDFGNLDDFIKTFNAQTVAVQGSGWGWLECIVNEGLIMPTLQVYNKVSKKLEITTTPNQNPVTGPLVPLLGIDVWEHAYYLQYKNVRPDYLKAVWSVVNWKDVSSRYVLASQ
ncbi:Superoxide dismutase [Mn], mitochondrial [Dinochytrium kinnereticum]|nr:Superoxide dismutase [Mn], mitochondrial [Dinochytrium kinnereticum]